MDEREKTKQQAAVMLAFVGGKEIQSRDKETGTMIWDKNENPIWDWFTHDYRIKPNPPRKLVRYYVCVKKTGKLLGGFITKEDADISCASYNRGCRIPEFYIVPFELTEIQEDAT